MIEGYVCIPRSMIGEQDTHGTMKREPFCKRAAFLWLIANAAFRDTVVTIGTQRIALKRGQQVASIRYLASKWGWSTSKVTRGVSALQAEGEIETSGVTGITIVTVCNYERFLPSQQNAGTAKMSQEGVSPVQKRDKGEEVTLFGDKSPQRATTREESDFEKWYEIYPHKVGREAALKAFIKARKIATLEAMIRGVERYIASKPEDRAYCNPATWLNQGRWNDNPAEVIPLRRSAAASSSGDGYGFDPKRDKTPRGVPRNSRDDGYGFDPSWGSAR